jgi:hypothetical protein
VHNARAWTNYVLHLVLHLIAMPTSRHRYTITETEPIAQAIEKGRRCLDTSRNSVVVKTLILRGAEALERDAAAAQQDAVRREQLKRRFLQRGANFEGLDPEAMLSVREAGWTREHGAA